MLTLDRNLTVFVGRKPAILGNYRDLLTAVLNKEPFDETLAVSILQEADKSPADLEADLAFLRERHRLGQQADDAAVARADAAAEEPQAAHEGPQEPAENESQEAIGDADQQEPEAADDNAKGAGRQLSELCLALEYELRDPALTAEKNEALRVDVDEARSEGQLSQHEVDHLLAIVSRNAERLTA